MSKIGNHRVGVQETPAYQWGYGWASTGMPLHPWMMQQLDPAQAEAARLGWNDYHAQEQSK